MPEGTIGKFALRHKSIHARLDFLPLCTRTILKYPESISTRRKIKCRKVEMRREPPQWQWTAIVGLWCLYMRARARARACVCVCGGGACACACVHVCARARVCMCVCVNIGIYVFCICVYIYIYIYIYIHIYIYIYIIHLYVSMHVLPGYAFVCMCVYLCAREGPYVDKIHYNIIYVH